MSRLYGQPGEFLGSLYDADIEDMSDFYLLAIRAELTYEIARRRKAKLKTAKPKRTP